MPTQLKMGVVIEIELASPLGSVRIANKKAPCPFFQAVGAGETVSAARAIHARAVAWDRIASRANPQSLAYPALSGPHCRLQ
jgi:hypothetical protein